jgi:exodeoxyribonuclease VIII
LLEEFQSGKEGVFDIPEHIYFNHKLAPEVNRGLVVAMLNTSPEHVKALIDGALEPKKASKAMEIGSLFDKALLEPHRFKEGVSHWVRPEHIDNLNTKEGRQWKLDHPGDIPTIKHQESLDIQGMIESVMRRKVARRIIEESTKQESAFAKDPNTGLLRKCRTDARLIENSGRLLIADVKSTFFGCASPDVWSVHCARMNYHMQDIFYSGIHADLSGAEPFFVFLVVERRPPYAVRIFDIHEEGRNRAREKCQEALARFQECKASGIWPSYPETIQTIRLPVWELHPKEVVE